MAFNNKQKTEIELLKQSPNIFLQKILNKEINFDSFKDESFQDGKGFSHILIDSYSSNPSEYLPIIKEMLKSSLTLKDSFKDFTPIESFFNTNSQLSHFYSDKGLQIDSLYNLMKEGISSITTEDYSRAMYTFVVNEQWEKFDDLFLLKKQIGINDYWQRIFEKLITENNLDKIKFIVEHGENTKEEITKIPWNLSSRQRQKVEERSSLLLAAIRYSDDISNYFLDNINFSLDGKTSENKLLEFDPYRTSFPANTREKKKIIFKSIHPLFEAFTLDKKELFKSIFNKLDSKLAIELIYCEYLVKKLSKPDYRSYSSVDYEKSEILLTDILNNTDSPYYIFFKDNIKNAVSKINNTDKLYLIDNVLSHKTLSLSEKLFFAENIIPELGIEEKKDYSYSYNRGYVPYSNDLPKRPHTILTNFFKDLYSKEKLSTEEINLSSKILNLALNNPNSPFNDEDLYTKKLFLNNILLNGFIAQGLDIKKGYSGHQENKIMNPFFYYCEMASKGTFSSTQQLDPVTPHIEIINKERLYKNFNTLKALSGDNINLKVYNGSWKDPEKKLLNYALSHLDYLLLDNLTDKEILNLAQNDNSLYCISAIESPSTKNELEIYRKITKRMFGLGFSYFNENNSKDFFKLLEFHDDTDFLFKVLEKEKHNIEKLSYQVDFWKHINSENVSNFVFDNGANYQSLDMTLNIINFDDTNCNIFDLYLKNGGNTNFTNENDDSMLHFLIKNNLFKQATHLLVNHPEQTQHVNKQNKIPLSYMIVGFDRECKKVNKNNPSAEFLLQKQLFEKYLEYGDFGENTKSKKFLFDQLSKYQDIQTIIPNFKEIISYKIMEAATLSTEDPKKEIRHKL